MEDLIKQIDIADAKSREMQDTLVLKEAEFNRSLKLVEQRFLYSRGKDEEREVLHLKQEN